MTRKTGAAGRRQHALAQLAADLLPVPHDLYVYSSLIRIRSKLANGDSQCTIITSC